MIFSTIDSIIFALLACCWIIQILYYWVYLAKPYFRQRTVDKGKIVFSSDKVPVSVIIYAHNHGEKLEKYLPVILEQDYPQYEVIVVDDGSTDDTELLLKQYASCRYLYYTYVPPESKKVSRRKLALSIGIKAARHDHLLFLDADSCPASPDWLHLMARHFIGKTSIVLGFSILKKQPSHYATYDYFFSNLQMMALALVNRPYTGNGKNLGYNKSALAWQRIFSDFSFLAAGDDDILVSELATRDNVSVELSADSVIQVNMEKRWMWKELKIKRMTTSRFYRKLPLVFWIAEKFFRLLFYFLFALVCVWFYPNWVMMGVAATLFLTRFATQWTVINRTAEIVKLPKRHIILLIFDFIQPFVDGYFYLYRIFQRKTKRNRQDGLR